MTFLIIAPETVRQLRAIGREVTGENDDARRYVDTVLSVTLAGRGRARRVAEALGMQYTTMNTRAVRYGYVSAFELTEMARMIVARRLGSAGATLAYAAADLAFSTPQAYGRWVRKRFGVSGRSLRADGGEVDRFARLLGAYPWNMFRLR